MSKTYRVNEIFYSLQGEGKRAGTPNVFIRFSGCNMECRVEEGPKSPGGFDCDTEFASGRTVILNEILAWIGDIYAITIGEEAFKKVATQDPQWIILTGGEPGLQVDEELITYFHKFGWKLAIETNGSVKLPTKTVEWQGGTREEQLIDWITLSPKVAEHAVKQLYCNEIKYVRGLGQGIPKPRAIADHYLISPAFDGNQVHPKTMEWCQKLVLENPQWCLSVQQHKQWRVR